MSKIPTIQIDAKSDNFPVYDGSCQVCDGKLRPKHVAVEMTRQYEDKLRKLSEERESLHKDYEQRLREIELRQKGKKTDDK